MKRTLAAALISAIPVLAGPIFLPGNLVVTVEGNGVQGASSGAYTDNQASPLTLFQFAPTGTSSASFVNSFVLPQTASGANWAVSAEYGSSSEGTLQLSGDGRYLTIAGYGVNAAAFNAAPGTYGPDAANTALAQSGSLTGQSYTAIPRVLALIDSNGNVDSSTALFNVFNTNNPRSVYTQDGSKLYVSGQGADGDNTGGVFLAQHGSNSAVSITGNDAGSGASQDTRTVQIYNGTLYVSADSKKGSTNRDYIGTLGTAGTPPTSQANGGNGPARIAGFGNSGGTGKVVLTATTANGVNSSGQEINLSPSNYFFANASTLYVADTGSPKNTSAQNDPNGSPLGDGGLQKWVNSKADGSGTWTLQYTLANGLDLVMNTQTAGVTGLYGLTGKVVGNQVQLFATSSTIGDLDATYLYGITDALNGTTGAGESFSVLAQAPVDSNFKGVSFAPTVLAAPEPGTMALLGAGLLLMGVVKRRSTLSSARI